MVTDLASGSQLRGTDTDASKPFQNVLSVEPASNQQ